MISPDATVQSKSYHYKLSQILTSFGSEEILSSDEKVVFLTSLPKLRILKALYDLVVLTVPVVGTGNLPLFQQFTCYLMKMRLNCPGPFLASLFDVFIASVS